MNVIWVICTALLFQAAEPSANSSSPALNSAPSASNSAGALNPAQQLAPVIQGAIRANAERLAAVELSVSRTIQTADVTEKKTEVIKDPDGTTTTITTWPTYTQVDRVVILDDRLRVDQGGGSGDYPPITYWFDGIRWTESNAKARRIEKRHPQQMGGSTLDPRDPIAIDHRVSLADVLTQPALKDATLSTRETVTSIATICPVHDLKMILDFDSACGMLPTRTQFFHSNGALYRSIQFSYAWIADRAAWALSAISERRYEDTVDGLGSPEKWQQQMMTSVTCTLLDREAAGELLSPVIPDGFKVTDYTVPNTRRQKSPPSMPVAAARFPLRWFVLAHLLLFSVAAVVIVWRRRYNF